MAQTMGEPGAAPVACGPLGGRVVSAGVGPAWRRLFDELDRLPDPAVIDRALLVALLEAVPSCERWIDAAAVFSERGYQRNLLRGTGRYEALLMCWRRGQRSPVHDHAGSLCAVRVLRGVVTETRYERGADGELSPAGTVRHPAGSVCVSYDADIHEISNEESGETDLMTLHVYLPPLRSMQTYPIRDPLPRRVREEQFGLLEGAGI